MKTNKSPDLRWGIVALTMAISSTAMAEVSVAKIAHLTLNNGSGNVSTDLSGNGNDATLVGNSSSAPMWLEKETGYSLIFNGYDQYAQLPHTSDDGLDNLHASNFSISLWFKTATKPAAGSSYALVSKWEDYKGIYLDENGKIVVRHGFTGPNDSSGDEVHLRSTRSYADDKYHQLVLTVDRNSGTVSLFVDGGLVNQVSFTDANIENVAKVRPWLLGARHGGNDFFEGHLDNVTFYTSNLDETDVSKLWFAGNVPDSLAELALNEGTGDTAYDTSEHGNFATLKEGAAWSTELSRTSLMFDGVNAHAEIRNVQDSKLDKLHRDSYSISAWVKPTATQSYRTAIVNRYGYHEGLFYSADNHFVVYHKLPNSNVTKILKSTNAYLPGQYYHVISSVDHDNGKLSLYVDGELENSIDFTPEVIDYDFFRPWTLGAKDVSKTSASDRESFTGHIDNLKLYSSSLDGKQAHILNILEQPNAFAQCSLGNDAGTGTGNTPTVLTTPTHDGVTPESFRQELIAGDKKYNRDNVVSFEQASVPSQWSTNKGRLSINSNKWKAGSKSLKWDWTYGDVLTVSDLKSQDGLQVEAGSSTYSNNKSFRLWLYNAEPIKHEPLQVEFYDDNDKLQYHYQVNLDFKGWRAATVNFRDDMNNDEDKSVDLSKMQIKAPTFACSGSLYLDLVDFKGYYLQARGEDKQVPTASSSYSNHWSDLIKYENYPKTLLNQSQITASHYADAQLIRNEYRAQLLATESTVLAGLTAAIDAFNDIGISVIGNDVVAAKSVFPPHHKSAFGIKVGDVDKFIMPLALDAYRNPATVATTERFVNTIKYLLDQGFAYGSMVEDLGHIGYSFRNITNAVLLNESLLKQQGLWNDALNMVYWVNAVEKIWEPSDINDSNADHAKTRVPFIAGIISHLYNEDDPQVNPDNKIKRVQYLHQFGQHLEVFLTDHARGGEGIKPDYSIFHHNTHFPGYSYGAIESLAEAVRYINQTSFAISAQRYSFLSNLIKSYAVQHAGIDMPLSLSGRNAFKIPKLHLAITELSKAESDGSTEQTAALAMYNRLYAATDGSGKTTNTLSVSEEANPEGFWQFNYRTMGTYRQNDWVANIKGLTKYLWGSEIYLDANRYGRYQSYGSIVINYQLPTLERGNGFDEADTPVKGLSGYVEEGWDWNKMPGTTVKHYQNLDDLKAEKGRQDEYATGTFAGSLRFGSKANYYIEPSVEGECGLFAMDFQQYRDDWVNPNTQAVTVRTSTKHESTFKFKQSVFACDGYLVVLGSDITSQDNSNNIATNLFQQSTAELGSDTRVYKNQSGFIRESYPEQTLRDNFNTLVDLYGTGYYIKRGDAVKVDIIAAQQSPNHIPIEYQIRKGYDNPQVFSYGEFASAWIDHGAAPASSKYEYVIVPKHTDKDRVQMQSHMWSFANDQEGNNNASPYYEVKQQDGDAHIIAYASGLESYVLFNATTGFSGTYVEATDTPIMVMAKEQGGSLNLSLVNPDHNFRKPVLGDPNYRAEPKTTYWQENQVTPVRLTLKGEWVIQSGNGTVESNTTNTVIAIDTTDAKAYDLVLSPKN